MSEQNSGELVNTPPIDEGTEWDTKGPAARSDPLADKVVVDAALIDETPMGETIVHEAATVEPPHTAPVGELVAGESGVSTAIPYVAPVVDTITHEAPAGVSAGLAALLSGEEAAHFRTRWNEIQGSFVDEPRTAVQQADVLVSEAVGKITQMFASERSDLESQWKQSKDVSTEDLRKALQRYRSFFNRLVV